MVKTQTEKQQERERSHEIFSRLATVTKKQKQIHTMISQCLFLIETFSPTSWIAVTIIYQFSESWEFPLLYHVRFGRQQRLVRTGFKQKVKHLKASVGWRNTGATVPPASPSLPQRRPSNGYATLVRNGFQLNGTRIIFTVRKASPMREEILFIAIKLPPRDCTVSWL